MTIARDWIERARSVRIEDELGRRGIKLNRGKIERCGPCPRCGGDDRFSINTRKQVFNCRVCKAGGDVIDLVQFIDGANFMRAVETLTGEPPPKAKGKAKTKTSTARKVVAAMFSYHDANGALAFVVERIEYQNADGSFVGKHKKTFRQKRPKPDCPGEWIWNVDGIPPLIYRLDEVTEAIANGHEIIIVEGEAKADLLWSWNVPATCCSQGAGKWKAEHSEQLRDADIIILPDNDARGREHRDIVGHSLQGVAASVRVLDLPGLAPKGDVIDWAKAGGTVEQLHELITKQAKPWEEQNHHHSGDEPTIALQSVRASAVTMTAVTWLWPNRLALGKLGIFAGLPDEGKGQILCYIAAQTTHGGEWPCNEGHARRGSVVMLTAEDDTTDTIVPRLAAAGADLDRVHITNMVRDNGKKRMFSLVTDLESLRRKIIEIGDVVLVEIDPISAYLGVGKIDSFRTTDVRAVLGPLVELAAELKIAVIGIMHFNKKVDITNALLRISDSLAFGATARHVYGVVNDAEHKRKLVVRAKNNLAPDTNKALAYQFGAREVGVDPESGKPILAPHIIWDGVHVDVTATEAMQAASENKAPAARDEAKKFLQDILAHGAVAKTEIDDAASAHNIAPRTLARAKGELKIMAKKDAADGGWTWRLPNTHWSDE